jgi:hypothetical protein
VTNRLLPNTIIMIADLAYWLARAKDVVRIMSTNYQGMMMTP